MRKFNMWKKEGQGFHRSDPSIKLRSLGRYGVRSVVPSSPRRPPRVLRLPRPSRCPLPPRPSCAFSPLGGGSRVFAVSWYYVEASLGTARPITQAVDKVEGDSCGQKG